MLLLLAWLVPAAATATLVQPTDDLVAVLANADAGAELKTKAPAEFFAMLIENGGNW